MKNNCTKCVPIWGELGKCKKHSDVHTIRHMGFIRYLWVGLCRALSKNVRISKALVVPILTNILVVGMIILFAANILYLINVALKKQEFVACKKLESYSQTYPLFYITESEKAMCDAHGVSIDAPVK